MECDSSDDEGYQYNVKESQNAFFPWFKKDYKHIYDQLDYTEQERVSTIKEEQYPTSEQTDRKIILKPKEADEVPLPKKILVVSPNSFTVDQLLSKTVQTVGESIKLLRLGHSLNEQELNKKYSLDHLSGAILAKAGEHSEKVDALKYQILEKT